MFSFTECIENAFLFFFGLYSLPISPYGGAVMMTFLSVSLINSDEPMFQVLSVIPAFISSIVNPMLGFGPIVIELFIKNNLLLYSNNIYEKQFKRYSERLVPGNPESNVVVRSIIYRTLTKDEDVFKQAVTKIMDELNCGTAIIHKNRVCFFLREPLVNIKFTPNLTKLESYVSCRLSALTFSNVKDQSYVISNAYLIDDDEFQYEFKLSRPENGLVIQNVAYTVFNDKQIDQKNTDTKNNTDEEYVIPETSYTRWKYIYTRNFNKQNISSDDILIPRL